MTSSQQDPKAPKSTVNQVLSSPAAARRARSGLSGDTGCSECSIGTCCHPAYEVIGMSWTSSSRLWTGAALVSLAGALVLPPSSASAATSSITWGYSSSGDRFWVQALNMPAGAHVRATYIGTDGKVVVGDAPDDAQSEYWSLPMVGWKSASAVVVDKSGTVLSSSATLTPKPDSTAITWNWDPNRYDGFWMKAVGAPAGSRLHINYELNGTVATVNAPSDDPIEAWGDNLPGWTQAQAVLTDANGDTLATSQVITPSASVRKPPAVGFMSQNPDIVGSRVPSQDKGNVWVLQMKQYPLAQQIKANNPNARVFFYANMAGVALGATLGDSFQPNTVTLDDLVAHPQWALRTADGTQVGWKDYNYIQPVDTANREYQQASIKHLKAVFASQPQWDGVFLDDVNVTSTGHCWAKRGPATNGQHPVINDSIATGSTLCNPEDPASSYTPATPVTTGTTSQFDVYSGSKSFINAVVPSIRGLGKQTAINMESHDDAYTDQITEWGPKVESIFFENSGSWRSTKVGEIKPAKDYQTGSGAIWRVKEVIAAQKAGANAWLQTYASGVDTTAQAYNRALFLMGWDGTSDSLSINTSSADTDPWYTPASSLDVGTPTGPYTEAIAGSVLKRTFTNGVLYLNITNNMQATTTAQGGTVTIPALSSYIDPRVG